MGDVLVVRVLGALQLLGADVAEHDAEREEAEEAHHQDDVHQLLRLGVASGRSCLLQGLMGSGVSRRGGRLKAAGVEAVLQEGEQERLQLGAVEAGHH